MTRVETGGGGEWAGSGDKGHKGLPGTVETFLSPMGWYFQGHIHLSKDIVSSYDLCLLLHVNHASAEPFERNPMACERGAAPGPGCLFQPQLLGAVLTHPSLLLSPSVPGLLPCQEHAESTLKQCLWLIASWGHPQAMGSENSWRNTAACQVESSGRPSTGCPVPVS